MLKLIILSIIRLYQITLSPDHGLFERPFFGCRFYPSCSEYLFLAIKKYGLLKGMFLGSKRILRCQPFSQGGYNPCQ